MSAYVSFNYNDLDMNNGYDDMSPTMDLDMMDFFIFLFYTSGVMMFSVLFLLLLYVMVKTILTRIFGVSETGLTHEQSLLSPIFLESDGMGQTTSHTYDVTQYLDDPEEVIFDLENLSTEERFYYTQGEEYVKQNPPFLLLSSTDFDPIMTEQTNTYIEEEGAAAWEFQPDPNLPNDTVIVENKTDLRFLNYGYEASVMTTLPIPYKNRVYYYECKIYELNVSEDENSAENEVVSIGFASNPYPSFRLPGKHHHSVAYESNGSRRLNSSFPLSSDLQHLLPKVQKGDIMGIGYRTRSGTVFFTHNGKKIKEVEVGGHIRKWRLKYLYPIVGANVPCRVSCNFGTSGYVFVEANVKKWRFGSMHGLKVAPPAYGNVGGDMILEESHSGVFRDMRARGRESDEANSTLLGYNEYDPDNDDDDDYNDMDDYDVDDTESNNSEATTDGNDRGSGGHFSSNQLSLPPHPPPPAFDFSNSAYSSRLSHSVNDAFSLNSFPPTNPPEYHSDVDRN